MATVWEKASSPRIFPNDVTPRLIVTAVELETSQPVAFDSAHRDITPDHIVASGSLPPGFPPTEIDGLHYWDGGLWSNTPLPEVLAAVRSRLTLTWGVETFVAPLHGHLDDMVAQVADTVLGCGRIRWGDSVVIVAGSLQGRSGATDLIRVLQLDSPGDFNARISA